MELWPDNPSDGLWGNVQANLELHERTLEALCHAKHGVMTDEDFSLLCWHAGINYEKEMNLEIPPIC